MIFKEYIIRFRVIDFLHHIQEIDKIYVTV